MNMVTITSSEEITRFSETITSCTQQILNKISEMQPILTILSSAKYPDQFVKFKKIQEATIVLASETTSRILQLEMLLELKTSWERQQHKIFLFEFLEV